MKYRKELSIERQTKQPVTRVPNDSGVEMALEIAVNAVYAVLPTTWPSVGSEPAKFLGRPLVDTKRSRGNSRILLLLLLSRGNRCSSRDRIAVAASLRSGYWKRPSSSWSPHISTATVVGTAVAELRIATHRHGKGSLWSSQGSRSRFGVLPI